MGAGAARSSHRRRDGHVHADVRCLRAEEALTCGGLHQEQRGGMYFAEVVSHSCMCGCANACGGVRECLCSRGRRTLISRADVLRQCILEACLGPVKAALCVRTTAARMECRMRKQAR